MRPPGSGVCEGDILFQEGRARFRSGPIDVSQQTYKSTLAQMACERLAVKVVRIET